MGRSLRFIAQFLSKKIKETEFPIPTSISRDGRKVFLSATALVCSAQRHVDSSGLK